MKRFLLALMVLGLFGATPQASGACRWFGTQLECDFGGSQVLLGTQGVAEPTYARALRPQSLLQGSDVLDARAVPERPLRLDLQNVGADPRACQKWGNETYCN
jgi:hypothetical protein